MMEESESSFYHCPVLVEKVVEYLVHRPGGVYLDVTLGGGGHARAVLEHLNDAGRLIGMDRDEDALAYSRQRLAPYEKRITLVKGDIARVKEGLESLDVDGVDGFFADLGISSWQIDTPDRGFSYLEEGPLDMRMDASAELSARDVIHTYSETELADLFYYYGEERRSRRIARRIVQRRTRESLETTLDLAKAVRSVTPPPQHVKTLSRIWQALRFEVNDELNQLRTGLESVYSLLNPGGRMVIISWESLMDRMVKRFFRGEEPDFTKKEMPQKMPRYQFNVITRKVVRPDEAEIEKNPRARSARLRAAEKIESGKNAF